MLYSTICDAKDKPWSFFNSIASWDKDFGGKLGKIVALIANEENTKCLFTLLIRIN